jgi:hypothetical protein
MLAAIWRQSPTVGEPPLDLFVNDESPQSLTESPGEGLNRTLGEDSFVVVSAALIGAACVDTSNIARNERLLRNGIFP